MDKMALRGKRSRQAWGQVESEEEPLSDSQDDVELEADCSSDDDSREQMGLAGEGLGRGGGRGRAAGAMQGSAHLGGSPGAASPRPGRARGTASGPDTPRLPANLQGEGGARYLGRGAWRPGF